MTSIKKQKRGPRRGGKNRSKLDTETELVPPPDANNANQSNLHSADPVASDCVDGERLDSAPSVSRKRKLGEVHAVNEISGDAKEVDESSVVANEFDESSTVANEVDKSAVAETPLEKSSEPIHTEVALNYDFESLQLSEPTSRALNEIGYTRMTEVRTTQGMYDSQALIVS